MSTMSDENEVSHAISKQKEAWLGEIIRETQDYYQGELQQDQRVSWLLASDGVLIAIVTTIGVQVINKIWIFSTLLVVALVAFFLSGFLSVLTLLPLHGIRFWKSVFGRRYSRDLKIGIDQLVQERFRHGVDWSSENYEVRIKYHFRSHYLRFHLKAYGVLWSSGFFLIGLFLLAIIAIISVLYR